MRNITLDSETAHPCLVLSEDLRSVRFGNTPQDMPGHPQGLDFSATVLGVERFSSGRHYWEVDVEKATRWQLGIYQGSADRRANMPKASGDQVLLTGSIMGTDFTLWVSPPLKKVSMRQQMHQVGVFLDYEYGQVSFYNVTEKSLIYNFSYLAFQGAVRPVFSLCFPDRDINSDSLTISSPQVPNHNIAVSS
ncbi:probable E3 ubiquitin-protein ligase TRIML2 [Tupaia chinensis]|uniref:probable E3 ubiquitin-protein ligase TRIML2 n=1 Tax=Tupaia chinensis TaxID=246437 RepID=UPI000FFB552A|nr:probable E3 ubiquitin-protein ligase TRIML2 [Tupaia chinensis]